MKIIIYIQFLLATIQLFLSLQARETLEVVSKVGAVSDITETGNPSCGC